MVHAFVWMVKRLRIRYCEGAHRYKSLFDCLNGGSLTGAFVAVHEAVFQLIFLQNLMDFLQREIKRETRDLSRDINKRPDLQRIIKPKPKCIEHKWHKMLK